MNISIKPLILFFIAVMFIYSSCANEKNEPAKDKVDYFKEGEKALSNNNFDLAISKFTKAIESKPNDAKSYYFRGLSHLYKMDLKPAVIDFTKVIEIDSGYADAFNNRGLAYSLMGNTEMAIQDLTEAIEMDPTFAQAYVNRGTAYLNWNNPESAMEDFNKALELDKDNPMAYYQRGLIYYKNKDYKKAKEDFKTAAGMGLRKEDIYYNLGNCHYHLKEFDKAIDSYTKALQLNPQNTNALNNRAMAYDKAGKKELADKDREALKELNVEILELPEESGDIKYKKFVSGMGEISIELPANWHKVDEIGENTTNMIVSKDSISSMNDMFTVGVNMSLNKNMGELYGVSDPVALLDFWKGSSGQNAQDYAVYDIFSQKMFPREGWEALLNQSQIQVRPDMPLLTVYELVLTREDILFYAYLQAPATHFVFYEDIFEKAIESIKVRY